MQFQMQEENRRPWRKTSGSKYGLETKCTYSAGIGDQTQVSVVHSAGEEQLLHLLSQTNIIIKKKKKKDFLSFVSHPFLN